MVATKGAHTLLQKLSAMSVHSTDMAADCLIKVKHCTSDYDDIGIGFMVT